MHDRRAFLTALGAAGAGAFAAGCTALGESDDDASLEPPDPRFEEVASDLGLEFSITDFSLANGLGGVFVTDYDGDGREDVLVTGPDGAVLFENTGRGFEPSGALPDLETVPRTAVFFDHDNSGTEDVLLVPWEGSPTFLANVGGAFERREVGFDVELDVGMGVTAADFHGDGYPDVFIAQNGDWREATPVRGVNPTAREDNGKPNYLFRGDGESFELVEDAPIHDDRWSIVTNAVDLTGNGWPDIHVANDFNYDVLYRNQGEGEFVPIDLPASNRHGMSSTAADLTGDGRTDLFVTNIRFPNPDEVFETKGSLEVDNRGNILLVNQGDGEFVDKGEEFGVAEGGWGWAAVAADFTNDGHPSLAHATRFYRERGDPGYDLVKAPPKFWQGTADGFEELDAETVGLEPTDGRGLAVLDYDVDGRLDLVAGNNNGPFRFYRNRADAYTWLQVVVEPAGDQTALGAAVTVEAGDRTRTQTRDARTDFLAQGSRVLHFGLRGADAADRVTVQWPDGTEWTVEDVAAGQRIFVSPDGIEERIAPESET